MKDKLYRLFTLQKLPFWGVFVLSVIMGVATFVEKEHGTDYAYTHIYGSWWFSAIWGIMATLSLVGMIKGKLYKNPSLFLVHISFILILVGALCTKLFAEHGYIVLHKDEVNNRMQTDKEEILLPFRVKLDTFYISYYAGTNAPADYVSHFTIEDSISKDNISARVSMNDIFTHNGYRFYQSSYEDDKKTSVLSINHDTYGIPLTYTGYALFILSMIWFLLSPKNIFRQLLRHPLLKKAVMLAIILIPSSGIAQVLTKDSLTVNKEQAADFGKAWVLYDGRITPITTLAHDFTLKVTGKTSFSYLNADQFLMGFLFFPDKWQNVALFEIKDEALKKELNAETEKAALIDFYDLEGNYKLSKYWEDLSHNAPRSPQLKEVEKLNEKIQLIDMLHGGSLLQIYPQQIGTEIKWYYPTQNLRTPDEQKNIDIVRNSLLSYYKAILSNDERETTKALNIIKDYQKQVAFNVLPSDLHLKAELLYTKVDFASILFKVNLTLGILTLICLFAAKGKISKRIEKPSYILLIISFCALTFSIALRTYIGGRLPFSNGFETMLLVAWCAMLVSAIFGRRIPILLPFGYLISGCSLLVAHLGMMNPQITPLVPVLSSPLLSIHVSIIMIAYTLLGFIMLNSLTSMIQILIGKKGAKEKIMEKLEQNRIYSLICLYPSILFLGAGIFIGAVWANISWGRYWGWDPKEVWALITLLIYSLIIHQKNIKLFADPFFFHAYGLIAFFSILMTYFGVNYFLGGMHSYAGNIEFDSTIVVILSTTVVVAALMYFSYRKYKSLS